MALITGGASGIGKALAESLATRGTEVVIADRQADECEAVAAAIRANGGRAYAVVLDVRDRKAFDAVAADVVRRSGSIDYFFNNAGIAVMGDVQHYAPRDWDDVFDVNLRGVVHGIDAVYPRMIAQGHGHIVNTASVAGLLPSPNAVSYTASKHAVVGLSKSLRIEAAVHGVRVSALCPGAIRTPILTGGRFGRTELSGISKAGILGLWEKTRPMAPDVFAERVLDVLPDNDPYIIVPTWWRLVWLLERFWPSLSIRLFALSHAQVTEVRRLESGAKSPVGPDADAGRGR